MAKKINVKKSLFTLILAACLSTVPMSIAAIDVQKDSIPVSGIDMNDTYRNTFDTPTTLNRAETNRADRAIRNQRLNDGTPRSRYYGDTMTATRNHRYLRNYRRNAFSNGLNAPTSYRYRTSGMNSDINSGMNTTGFNTANINMTTFGNANDTVAVPDTAINTPNVMSGTAMTNPAGLTNTTAGAPSTFGSTTGTVNGTAIDNTTARPENAVADMTMRTPTGTDMAAMRTPARSTAYNTTARPNSTTIYNAASSVGGQSRSGISSRNYNQATHDVTVIPNTSRARTTRSTAAHKNATLTESATRSTTPHRATSNITRNTTAVNPNHKNIAPAIRTNRNTPSASATVTRRTNNTSSRGNVANHTRTRNNKLHVNADVAAPRTHRTNRTNRTNRAAEVKNRPAVTQQNAQTKAAVNANAARSKAVVNNTQATPAYKNSVNNIKNHRSNTAANAVGANSVYEHYEYTARYPADSTHAANARNADMHTAMTDSQHTNTGVPQNHYRNNEPDGTYRDHMVDGVYRNSNAHNNTGVTRADRADKAGKPDRIGTTNNTNNRNTNTNVDVNVKDRAAKSNIGLYRTDDMTRDNTMRNVPAIKGTTGTRGVRSTTGNVRTDRTGVYRTSNPMRNNSAMTRTRLAPTAKNTTVRDTRSNNTRAETSPRVTRSTEVANNASSVTFIIVTIAVVLLIALAAFALMRPRRRESDNDMAGRRQ